MDTDDGVEVVWNEVRYSNRKIAKGSKVGYSDKSVVSSLASQTQPTTDHFQWLLSWLLYK